MPLTLQLTSESGEVIDEFLCGWVFDFILNAGDLSKTTCLRFLDPYGDTVFNRLQAPVLIEEIQAAAALVADVSITQQHKAYLTSRGISPSGPHPDDPSPSSADVRDCTAAIIDLARRCEKELDSYLMFVGD